MLNCVKPHKISIAGNTFEQRGKLHFNGCTWFSFAAVSRRCRKCKVVTCANMHKAMINISQCRR